MKNLEVWKDIKGFEGYYQVSDLGNVRSITRLVGHPKGGLKQLIGTLMTPYNSKQGYLVVTLRNKGRKVVKVHRLVCIAFLPNSENKENVNHKNGNKHDNRLINLEWITQKENIDHAYKTGLSINFGENHSNSKFTKSQIFEIRENKSNLTQKELSILFGTCQSVISRIMKRKLWKNI